MKCLKVFERLARGLRKSVLGGLVSGGGGGGGGGTQKFTHRHDVRLFAFVCLAEQLFARKYTVIYIGYALCVEIPGKCVCSKARRDERQIVY